MQDTQARGAFMKDMLSHSTKKICNELFFEVYGFRVVILMKVKVTPFSNKFFVDAIQTFQGYQFRGKKDNSLIREDEERKVRTVVYCRQ